MYQPSHGKFAVDDPGELLTQVSTVVPATLVTISRDGRLRTSILPMLFHSSPGRLGVLHGHVARLNDQWRDARADVDAMAIFNGADAYISPAWYEEKRRTGRVVPTWNYTTVVVHGVLAAHDESKWVLEHVRELVELHEAGRPDPWSVDDAPSGYIEGQAKGIVGLELHITRIDAKQKLAQNRSAADIAGAIAGLEHGTPREQAVAADMRREISTD